MFVELPRLALFIELGSKENSYHAESICSRIIGNLECDGVRYMLEMLESAIQKKINEKISHFVEKAHKPRKNITPRYEVHSFSQIHIRLLPVSIQNICLTTISSNLDCIDNYPWEGQLSLCVRSLKNLT